MSEKYKPEGDNVVSLCDFRERGNGNGYGPDGDGHVPHEAHDRNETDDVEPDNQDRMDCAKMSASASAVAARDVLQHIRERRYLGRGGNDDMGNLVSLKEHNLHGLLCRRMRKLAEDLGDVLSKASEYKATIQHLSLSDRVKERLPQWLQDRIGYNALTLSLREVYTITTQLDTLTDGLTELMKFYESNEQVYYGALALCNDIYKLQSNIPRTLEQEWYDDAAQVVRGAQYFFEDRV